MLQGSHVPLVYKMIITSISNNKIKNIIKLCTGSRARREQNAFVAEGVKMFIEAPSARIKEVYVSEDLLNKITYVIQNETADPDASLYTECAKKLENTGYELVTPKVFSRISDTVTPQGILCVMEKDTQDIGKMTEIHKEGDLRILVVENIRDPGNMGTMIRTMEAAGYDFMLASEGSVDVYNPKVIRSTMGSIYRIPVIYSDDLKRDIDLLKGEGVRFLAAHLNGQDLTKGADHGNRLAVMIGNEAAGLSREISDKADELVRIPMKGQVESLNAAVAAAVLMFAIS